ncbi:MAG: FAD-dependent monooxygenase [Steroidobacteraceae bacterium]|nr:FAD-dependent monooxygenase [Steroidobacteraceae bacterium]
MRQMDIALVGAGIAGLTAARALQTFGFRVRVYEQAPRLGEVGAGLTVSPNATHVLNAIGLQGVLERIGMRPERGGVKHWRTGELTVEIPRGHDMLDKYGAAYYQVHRADLHGALAEAILAHDPDAIVLGHSFETLHDDGRRVHLRFANGAAVTADVAIGADGLRSRVRTALFGAERPKFTGYIAYRGLVPVASLPPGIIRPTSCLSTGPGRSFTRYLLRGGTLVNFVGLCERDDWAEEGWSIRASVDEVLAEYAGWYEDVRTIIRHTPPEGLIKWALFDREPLERWTVGRVALLGDAAHPMLPFLGQGAAMGIEDGMLLARAFAAAGSLDEALQRYVEARQSRTTWVMLKSRETARTYHSGRSENFQPGRHVSAESLGIMAYNPAAVPV